MSVAEDMGTESRTPALRITLPARAENIAVIRQAIAGMAAELGADADLIDDIKTAVSEAVTNAVVHAYPDELEGPLEVSATVSGRQLEIAIRDRGVGMQPRPLSSDQPNLRVGLALIGALAYGVEIRGERNKGTDVRIRFDLDRDGVRPSILDDPPKSDTSADETVIEVGSAEPGGAAITKVLELLAARSDFSLDRLADAQLIGDFLAHWTTEASIDSKPLEVSVAELKDAIEIRVGPLEPGAGREMMERGDLPGYGNALEHLADRAELIEEQTVDGPADFVALRIGTR